MRRHQLEHIIRAAFGITAAPELVIIGSQDENQRGLCQARLQRVTP
jgi:hypothetical protein